MGRNSAASKRALRRKQKLKKKTVQLKCSLSSPPPSQLHILSESSDYSWDPVLTEEAAPQETSEQAIFDLVGVDKEAFQYEMDEQYGFPVDLKGDHKLDGEELVEHIKQSNRKLVARVKHYQKRCEQLEGEMFEDKKANKDKICAVREFYRDMLCYGYSRGHLWLQSVIESNLYCSVVFIHIVYSLSCTRFMYSICNICAILCKAKVQGELQLLHLLSQ